MNATFQNRHTGEFFERVWINGSHVGLVSLTDQREVKVKRSNLTKSYKLADDYRHVPPAPDPPEPMNMPLPVRVGDRLPGPRVAPRPTGERPLDAPKFWGGTITGTVQPLVFDHTTSSGNDRATQGANSVVRGTPTSRRSETFWNRLTWIALAVALLTFLAICWYAASA